MPEYQEALMLLLKLLSQEHLMQAERQTATITIMTMLKAIHADMVTAIIKGKE